MKKRLQFLFIVYIFIVLWITLINRESEERRYQLELFWEWKKALDGSAFYQKQVLGNLIMLMPYGFLLPIIQKSKFLQTVFSGFCFSLAIEITQYITGRGLFQLDDLFNNTIGALIGFMLYYVFHLIRKLIVLIKHLY